MISLPKIQSKHFPFFIFHQAPNRPRPPAPPTLKPEVPKPEEPKPEQPKPEEPKPEEPKPEQPTTAPEGVEPTAEPGLPAE